MSKEQKWFSVDVGVGRCSIEPKIGLRLCGSLRDENSTAIHDHLWTSVIIFGSEPERLAIVAIDAIIFSLEEAVEIRSRVAEVVGTTIGRVFLNLSHTHAVPAPPSFREFDPEDEDQWLSNMDYFSMVVKQTREAAKQALATVKPAALALSEGEVQIGVNRREILPDGTLALGENPDGPRDDRVGVVKIESISGDPIATIVHYSCHPDILGPKSTLISPDFIGPMRTLVEGTIGGITIFLQGCCADVDPLVGIVVGEDGVKETERLGHLLGAEVLKTVLKIGTRRSRSHRVYWKSQNSTVTGWAYGATEMEVAVLSFATTNLNLPLRPLPSLEDCSKFQQQCEEVWALLRDDASLLLSDRLVARRRAIWSSIQLDAARTGGDIRVDIPIHSIRVGPLALLGIAAEVFVEIGQHIENKVMGLAQLQECRPFVSGYTNGVYFYIPTKSSFPVGGYEVDSHRNYLKPSGPTADWESLVVDSGADVLRDVLS